MNFCNRSRKSWLPDKNIEIYSTRNEGESVVAERFVNFEKQSLQVYDRNIKN